MASRTAPRVLLLIAAFTCTVAFAPVAQAGEFEADEYPVTLTGRSVGQHEMQTGAGTSKCTVTYHGEEVGGTGSVHLTTTYSECTVNGVPATVTFLNCHTLLTGGETIGGESEIAVQTDLSCQEGGSIVVKVLFCQITIEPNQSLAGTVAKNQTTLGGKGEIVATTGLTGVRYIVDGGCPIANGTYENGVYTGTTTLEGEKPGNASAKIGVRVT
jgi:hypothetical protein